MLDGKSKGIYIIPDSTVFNDPDFPEPILIYEDLLNLRGNYANSIELKKGETSVAIVSKPTFFSIYDDFLAYPGERITIKKGKYNDFSFSKRRGSRRRNRELSFSNAFSEVKRFDLMPISVRGYYSLDTILSLERNLKAAMPIAVVSSRLIFDSLAKAFRVSKKFKRIVGDRVENTIYMRPYALYSKYRDSLQAHGLFIEKCKALIPVFNSITERSKFDGVAGIFNEVTEEIMPYKIRAIKTVIQFGQYFDTVQYYFRGFARDYLLSQLMYDAYKKRIPIGADYESKYFSICSDEAFKKLMTTLKSRQEKNNSFALVEGDNSLIAPRGKTASFENIIAQQKGKVIVLDFWATWCAPCKADMPYLRTMVKEYAGAEIVFLKISLDKDIQVWQKVIISSGETDHSYLMIDVRNSSFINQFDIATIPRYIILDKEGKVVNSDAPRPSDPAFKKIIDQCLGR